MKKKTKNIGAIAGSVVTLIGAIIGLVGDTPRSLVPLDSDPSFSVFGTFTLNSCERLGYSDISDGTEVDLTDAAGRIVSYGQLSEVTSAICSTVYNFSLPGVPSGLPFYGVTVSHRGTIHYIESQLRSGLSLSLGKD